MSRLHRLPHASSAALTRFSWSVSGLLVLALSGGCATPADPAAKTARATLTRLQADPVVSANANAELDAAARAVTAAEIPQANPAEAVNSAYIAQIRLQIAQYHAQAAVDQQQTQQLMQRRDQLRHGNDSITTLATDPFDATPHAPHLVPINKDTPVTANLSGDTPPPAPVVAKPVEPPQAPPMPEILDSQGVVPPSAPAVLLPALAFSGANLNSRGRTILDQSLIVMAKYPNRILLIASAQPAHVTAIRAYLLSKGMPAGRLAGGGTPPSDGDTSLNFGDLLPGSSN